MMNRLAHFFCPDVMIGPMNVSVYLHIPFCTHRCAYCDFNTYAGQESAIPAYVEALCQEIRWVGENAPAPLQVETIFFGGGTPSLLSPAHYRAIFQAIYHHYEVQPGAEISLEANPGTVSLDYLNQLREIGFNRISYGVQSANPTELRMLERIHSYSDVVDAVRWARRAGFENLNLDLIYGLPEQTLASWQRTVELILGLHPEHLSAYALTLEHGTPFGRWAARGLLPLPDPDLAAEMYEWLDERLTCYGYAQYEISNWAKTASEAKTTMNTDTSSILHHSSFQCRHNLQYWRNLPYLGLGAGAHGYANGIRYANVLRIKTYIERLARSEPLASLRWPLSPAAVNHHHNTPDEEMDETMMTGLRLTVEGVSAIAFRARFGLELTDVYREPIERLTRLGLLEWTENRLRLTRRGRLLGNQVFMQFLRERQQSQS